MIGTLFTLIKPNQYKDSVYLHLAKIAHLWLNTLKYW